MIEDRDEQKKRKTQQRLDFLSTESCSPSIPVLGNNRFTRMNDGEVALFSLKKGRKTVIALAYRLTPRRACSLVRIIRQLETQKIITGQPSEVFGFILQSSGNRRQLSEEILMPLTNQKTKLLALCQFRILIQLKTVYYKFHIKSLP